MEVYGIHILKFLRLFMIALLVVIDCECLRIHGMLYFSPSYRRNGIKLTKMAWTHVNGVDARLIRLLGRLLDPELVESKITFLSLTS